MTPHAKYGVKNLFRPFSKYQGSAPEFGATWVCLSALRTLLIRDYAVCIGELSQASLFWTTALITPKYQSAVCSSKTGLLWRAIPYRGVLSGKNRSDKESWGFTIDTAVNEHLTWSASFWVGPGLTQFWKHVQKVWMCGRCPRPTGPVSSRRSISSSVEHCLGSRRAVCCLFQPDMITEFAKYSKTFPLCMWYLWTILFKCKRLKFVTGIFFVIFKVS